MRRTQRCLRDALTSLIHEKSYDDIAVNEILDRADVGRSAFYAHFSSKDALLTSGIEQILHSCPPRQLSPNAGPFARVLWFSLPFFEHVGQCRGTGRSQMVPRGRAMVHQHLRLMLTRQIRKELKTVVHASDAHSTGIPTELLAEFIVGTFIIVLNWWVESDSPCYAREADDRFLRLVLPTLENAAPHRS